MKMNDSIRAYTSCNTHQSLRNLLEDVSNKIDSRLSGRYIITPYYEYKPVQKGAKVSVVSFELDGLLSEFGIETFVTAAYEIKRVREEAPHRDERAVRQSFRTRTSDNEALVLDGGHLVPKNHEVNTEVIRSETTQTRIPRDRRGNRDKGSLSAIVKSVDIGVAPSSEALPPSSTIGTGSVPVQEKVIREVKEIKI